MTEPARRRFDFHCHTFLSDGEGSATDMWSTGDRIGHRVLAVTDHVSLNDPRPVLDRLHAEARAFEDGPMLTLVGVEISMVPPRRIDAAAKAARQAGAEIVIVHGETLAEPVPRGTNRAAIECREVDLLAHPGLLTPEDAEMARAHGTYLELSGRHGHSYANGHVARTALAAKAPVVIDSDAHATEQLLPYERAEQIGRGAGLGPDALARALGTDPSGLVRRLGKRL